MLLKNTNNLLPLTPSARVLVTGPTAHSLNALNGGWTHTWQGTESRYNPADKQTVWQAIAARCTGATYVQGTTEDSVLDLEAAVRAAHKADVVVLCLGEMPYTEKPGDIDLLDLPAAQLQLAQAVAAAGKPVVLVLVEGRPRIVREIEPLAGAVLLGMLPGNEGGIALAEALFGEVNPSGKLPLTYPRYANDLVPYDHKGTDLVHRDFSHNGFRPQWQFGEGMSYTQFAYSDLRISLPQPRSNTQSVQTPARVLRGSDTLVAHITVTNTGKRPGKEVVQLYSTDVVASITPSVRRLRAFTKVELQPGESKTISFRLTAKDLAFVGRDNTWITEAGEFRLQIGDQQATFIYQP